MAARYYLTDEVGKYLQKKNISGLAQNAFDAGKKIVKGLNGELKANKKYLTMSADQFLVLAGTTAELKDFRKELNKDKIEAIGLDAAKGDPDPLVTWCARVDVKHPEKPLEKTRLSHWSSSACKTSLPRLTLTRHPKIRGSRSRIQSTTLRGPVGFCTSTTFSTIVSMP
jgi:hypothetical protein